MRRNFLFVHFTTQLKRLDFISSFSYFRLKRVLKYSNAQSTVIPERICFGSPPSEICFGSSSVHHATLFSTTEVSFLYLSCFRNIQRVKTTLAPEDEYCFLLLLLQAIVIIMGIALITAKAKSVIVFAIILFSWGIEGDS